MPITFVAVTAAPGGGTNPGSPGTVNTPTNINGDFLIMHVEQQNQAPFVGSGVVPSPGTWTRLLPAANPQPRDFTTFVFWKFASSEPASYTITPNDSGFQGASVACYRFVSNPTPIDLYNPNTAGGGTTVTATLAGATTSFNNELAIAYFTHWAFTSVISGPSSPWVQRFLSNTEVMYDNSVIAATSGVSPADASITQSGSIDWVAEYITIKFGTAPVVTNKTYVSIIT